MFENYVKGRDQQVFFESAGFDKSDVASASEAMRKWVVATQELIEAVDRVPETTSDLFGPESQLSETPLEQEIAIEVQRVRHTMAEANLSDLLDRVNQFAARINSACENI
jgi:hypothetical protein